MSSWTRQLRHVLGHSPSPRDCVAAIELQSPALTLIAAEVWDGDGPRSRHIGMGFQEQGVQVLIERIDLDELQREIDEARAWLQEHEQAQNGAGAA